MLQAQRERLESQLFGDDTWDDLERYVDWATSVHEQPVDLEPAKHLIFWGETDGVGGMAQIIELRTRYPGSRLLISGGVYGREETVADYPALRMLEELRSAQLRQGFTEEQIESGVVIDSIARHTGHQRMFLSALLDSEFGFSTLSVVIPWYHMPRFLASVGRGMKDKNVRPVVVPQPFGSAETHHERKAPKDGLAEQTFTYEELLCLPLTPSRGADEVKAFDCGELDKFIGYQQPGDLQALRFREAIEFFGIA
jgi:hypothetical protein